MFEPLVSGRIDTEGIRFDIHLADVEELNKSAQQETYDITKLSFNAFTGLTQYYQLLNSGSALGRKCGPLLIAKKEMNHQELFDGTISIPGENTTANFLLSFAYPDIISKKEELFSEIESSVINDKSTAGVIIHENRFTFQDKGLVQIKDLGEHWEEKTGFPIPLGGIVTRRRFTKELKQKIDRVIARSVNYALSNPDTGSEYIKAHAQEMEEHVMRAHINLYVNDFSSNLGNEGRASIQYLFDHHTTTSNGNYTTPLFIEQVEVHQKSEFLSSEYWSSRYQNDITGWDVGTITPPIKAYVDQLKDKSLKILIPGAGNAHEAEYLHRQGFSNVYVCDLAIEPLENLQRRCPDFPKEHLIHGNFFEIESTFDLILEQTFFCALDPSLRQSYADKAATILNSSGKLAGLLFGVLFPFTGPPFGGDITEYESLFKPRFTKVNISPCYNSLAPRSGNELFIIAQK